MEQPDAAIALTGIDGNSLVPLLVTFWYLAICFLLIHTMQDYQPADSLILEAMVIYNVFQAVASISIAILMLHEVWRLDLRFVGNPAPVFGARNHHLAIISIAH